MQKTTLARASLIFPHSVPEKKHWPMNDSRPKKSKTDSSVFGLFWKLVHHIVPGTAKKQDILNCKTIKLAVSIYTFILMI